MYRYTEGGLTNVWLSNGFREEDTPYGKGVSIEDVEGLHRVIGMKLVKERAQLTGAEFRFLRKELGLSQAKLAGCINREHGSQGVRAYSVNPGLVSTEAVTATLGEDGALAQRYGAMSPAAIAASLLWLATDSAAPALARKPTLIQLQDLVREHQLA